MSDLKAAIRYSDIRSQYFEAVRSFKRAVTSKYDLCSTWNLQIPKATVVFCAEVSLFSKHLGRALKVKKE